MDDIRKVNANKWVHKRNSIGKILTGIDDIKQCVCTIMEVSKGEVPLCPEFGTEIIRAIGENSDDAIDIAIAIFSQEIPKQEPRCELLDITGEKDEDGRVHIKAYIKEKKTGKTTTVDKYYE